MDEDDTKFVYRIGKLALSANDVVIIKTDLILTVEQIEQLRDQSKKALLDAGLNNNLLIVTHGCDIQVMEREQTNGKAKSKTCGTAQEDRNESR